MDRKKCFSIITIIVLTFTIFFSFSVVGNTNNVANWTVMYYMCGDNKAMDIFIEPLIENLSKIGSSNDVNIVALVDRLDEGDSKLYYFNGTDEKFELNSAFGWPNEVDMSNPNTLELYCKQIMQSFPARHYSFITYAPGGTGWQIYLIPDSSNGRKGISIPTFAEILNNITNSGCKKIDVLYTSCCMSTLELTYEISPYVNYMVTTQEHISGYDVVSRFYTAVWDLKNNSDMSPKDFAKQAAIRHHPHTFQYLESYGEKLSPLTKILNKLPFQGLHTVMMHSSVAVVNLSRIPELVNSVDQLSSRLILHLIDKNVTWAIKNARQDAREFGKAFPKFTIFDRIYRKLPIQILSYNSRIDLYNFVELLKNNTKNTAIKDLCTTVMENVNYSIVAIKKMPTDSAHGLNVYFPMSKYTYNRYILRGSLPMPYENLKFSRDTYWDDFLREYLGI